MAPGERGIVTLEARQPWQRDLMTVPLALAFSPEECRQNNSSFVMRISTALRDRLASSHALLHLCFLEHFLLLRTKSRFAPYLRSLPTNLSHLPLLTLLNVTVLLEGSPLLRDIMKHRRDLESLYEDIGWELEDFKALVSLEDFMFTYCMVESHSHAKHEGNETMPLMVPLLDLVNHRSQHANLHLGRTEAHEGTTANLGRAGAAAGDELFFTYSSDSEASSVFFKQFGFVDEHLTVAAKVALPLRPQHPGYAEKRLLFDQGLVQAKTALERLGSQDMESLLGAEPGFRDFPKFVLWRCGPEREGFREQSPGLAREELLPFARFVAFEGGLAALRAECDVSLRPPACRRPLPAAQEAAAARFLFEAVREHARRYPGSVEDDERLLADLAASASPAAPFIRIRRDERRCLARLLAEAQAIAEETPGALPPAGDAQTAEVGSPDAEAPPSERLHLVRSLWSGPAAAALLLVTLVAARACLRRLQKEGRHRQ